MKDSTKSKLSELVKTKHAADEEAERRKLAREREAAAFKDLKERSEERLKDILALTRQIVQAFNDEAKGGLKLVVESKPRPQQMGDDTLGTVSVYMEGIGRTSSGCHLHVMNNGKLKIVVLPSRGGVSSPTQFDVFAESTEATIEDHVLQFIEAAIPKPR